ncbi:MAG: DoxX family protein [Bacteroidetes bacterium]|nr:MAG: DoxX family protein [Bacteroidota bacterium]
MKLSYAKAGVWVLRILAAAIMVQSLFFKFSAAEESIYIFTTLGIEPWGRIGIGVLELVASALLLWPRGTAFGALLGAGLMGGALFAHVTQLGIVVKDDGGQLFIYAIVVLVACLALMFIHRQKYFTILGLKAPFLST